MGQLYDIPELKDCCIMQEKDIGSFADCFADGFEGYPLMNYFCGGIYDEEKIRLMWYTSIRAFNGQLLGVSDNEHINAAMLLAPPDCKELDLMSYLKAGAFRLVRSFGLKGTVRMQSFDTFAGKIKKKYMTNNCWYLFGFVSRKEIRGQGYSSKVLSPILAYFDRTGQDCYLETLDEKNVALYKRFGFELMEVVKLPDSDLTIYAMLRKVC